jgi:hypothetical protein
MSTPDEFHIDTASKHLAENLSNSLRDVNTEAMPKIGHAFLSSSSTREERARATAVLTDPLRHISREIGLSGVEADVWEFGLLGALASATDRPIRAVEVGSRPIPVLPAPAVLSPVLGVAERVIDRISGRQVRVEIVTAVLDEIMLSGPGLHVTVAEAQHVFFEGLYPYLAACIAGFSWLRSFVNRGLTPPATEAQGTITQSWTVHTRQHGLSMYYAGTHAIRNPPNYGGGVTTPLSIHLPMGTLYLGANRADTGGTIWEPTVVTVPSHTPVFHATRF